MSSAQKRNKGAAAADQSDSEYSANEAGTGSTHELDSLDELFNTKFGLSPLSVSAKNEGEKRSSASTLKEGRANSSSKAVADQECSALDEVQEILSKMDTALGFNDDYDNDGNDDGDVQEDKYERAAEQTNSSYAARTNIALNNSSTPSYRDVVVSASRAEAAYEDKENLGAATAEHAAAHERYMQRFTAARTAARERPVGLRTRPTFASVVASSAPLVNKAQVKATAGNESRGMSRFADLEDLVADKPSSSSAGAVGDNTSLFAKPTAAQKSHPLAVDWMVRTLAQRERSEKAFDYGGNDVAHARIFTLKAKPVEDKPGLIAIATRTDLPNARTNTIALIDLNKSGDKRLKLLDEKWVKAMSSEHNEHVGANPGQGFGCGRLETLEISQKVHNLLVDALENI